MSNAEEEEKIMAEIERVDAIADAAWREWEQTHALDNGIPPTCFRSGFALGYARGRADAWQLPEVRADELEEGKYYLGLHKHEGWHVCWKNSAEEIVEGMIFYRHGQSPSFTSFRGPLQMGDWK